MKIDLSKGVFIQIGGELGKYNSLPIDSLVKIAQELQNLLFVLAKTDLSSATTIDLNNLKIELTAFKKGSAVPQFAYSQRVENMCGMFWQENRIEVNEKFEKLIEISNTGDYSILAEIYPEPIKRNPIVETLYSFTSSFGNAPVCFIDYLNGGDKITPIYQIRKFKSKVKNNLLGEIKGVEPSVSTIDEVVGRIKITNKGGKQRQSIVEFYSDKEYSLEYAPEIIVFGSVKYILKFPLRCLFEKEEDYYIIQSELLGIIGTAIATDEAQNSFSEEFDFIYNKLNSLEVSELSEHNRFIKTNINHIVDKVEK